MHIDSLSFETLPQAIAILLNEVSELKKMLKQEKENSSKQETSEQFFNVQQTANFLGLTSATIYSKVSRNELPVMKRNGRLYFSKLELLEYLKEGKVNYQDSVSNEVDELLSNNKKGLRYEK
ncbi:helix-turn-helix domain-containing protein [uncultured Tenacibaculum sp.]|uniref:helix-turn-helix domain-containing protein n=1 Tax=uncultured Tenacibaculum sp. TaxID=174713 RepID=UPI00260D60A3|nr:helix-turn-helix domain-containing protein [uncultured Tenacibaculum sp.]